MSSDQAVEPSAGSPRLKILKASLAKKESAFDKKIDEHFADVRSANGQPLNDKRNGRATLGRWDKQDDALRTLKTSIEVTKQAIEREELKIAGVNSVAIPDFLQVMVKSGALTQWRRHPNTFFVPGVEKGRIVWDLDKKLPLHRYASSVPKEQFPLFRDAFNKVRAAAIAAASDAEVKPFVWKPGHGLQDWKANTPNGHYRVYGNETRWLFECVTTGSNAPNITLYCCPNAAKVAAEAHYRENLP